MSTRIGILKTGSTFAEMIVRFGDYDAWFERTLVGTGVETRTWDVVSAAPPPPDAADGWIVTGSRASLREPEPWSDRLLDWIRQAAAEEAPLLGVCYGHQAVCAALGGRVERSAAGWEMGTAEVELTEAGRADPLFAGFPPRFAVQTTHEDHVETLPPEAVVLARNAHAPVQAVAVGSSVRGVQFHPEVTRDIARDFVERRRHLLDAGASADEAPWGARVLANFVDGFVRAERAAGAGG